ncbi:MAG: 5-(carboxyamino)imidazole ribonucleotide synthase [Candidatus Pacearchaeota archaeon]
MYKKNYKIGILGGGQLGRMLIQSCIDFNIITYVMDPDPNAPCSKICHEFLNENFQDYDAVVYFGKKVDVLTIEIEHVNVDALFELQDRGVKVYPQPEIIQMVQDKGVQKKFFQNQGYPTAPFELLGNPQEEIKLHQDFLPAFLKSRKGGYDGRGVIKLENVPSDVSTIFKEPSVLEKKIACKKELAVIVARNIFDEIAVYPAVETVFHPEHHLVDYLISPAAITENIAKQAEEICIHLAKTLNLVGIMAVEFFLDQNENLYINEIAPRPHNSGHQSMEANDCSQFEMLLRAISGLPLGSTKILYPSVMINVLGEPGYTGTAVYQGLDEVLKYEGVYLHLYGKLITKPYRKMGHITVIDHSLIKAIEKAMAVKNVLKVIA